MLSQKALGLIFLLVTSAAWIGASFITQALVTRDEEEPAALEPWLLTLICSSTLMIYLPIGHCARKRARYEGRAGSRAGRSPRPRTRQRKGPTVGTSDDVAFEHASGCLHPRRRAAAAAAATAITVDSTAVEADDASEDDGTEPSDAELGAAGRGARAARGPEDRTGSGRNSRGSERQPLLHTHTHTHGHKHTHLHAHGLQQHGGGNVGGGSGDGGGGAVLAGGDADGGEVGGGGGGVASSDGGDVETSQIVRAAFVVAPVWFAAQLAFTASLEFTSVTSNTVLSSCSSLFVYLGSLAMGQEVSSALRFTSVLAAMAGTSLVALGDRQHEDASGEDGGTGGGSNPLFGDALTLLAAALYALYTIMMKRLLVKDDAIVMALFFGTIGVLYFAVLAPVVGALALVGSPVVRRVTTGALGLALVQGLIDYVAADYAWARAVMLLGPTATSCGLAMQIPAAGIIDAVLNGSHLSWSESPGSMVQFLFGSLLIIFGFVGVSLEPRVVSALWKRCTDCAGITGGAASGAGGGASGRLEAEVGVAETGLGDGRPDVATWESMPLRGGGPGGGGGGPGGAAGMDSAVGIVATSTLEERGGLLIGGEGDLRRSSRRGSGGGGWAGGGSGSGVGVVGSSSSAAAGSKARGSLRQIGPGGGGGGVAGGGGGGAVDMSMYIPLSSTAGAGGGGGVHVISGRSVPSAAVPDT